MIGFATLKKVFKIPEAEQTEIEKNRCGNHQKEGHALAELLADLGRPAGAEFRLVCIVFTGRIRGRIVFLILSEMVCVKVGIFWILP